MPEGVPVLVLLIVGVPVMVLLDVSVALGVFVAESEIDGEGLDDGEACGGKRMCLSRGRKREMDTEHLTHAYAESGRRRCRGAAHGTRKHDRARIPKC